MKYPVAVPGEGPQTCIGMVLGEAPGREEISQRRPFVGASGTLLTETLETLGVSREDFWITNAFRGDVGWGNPNPTPTQISDHMELLWRDVQDKGIQYILALGNVAGNAIIASAALGTPSVLKVTRDRGGWYRSWTEGRLFLLTYHPAYVLRSRKEREPVFIEDVAAFVERCQNA